jgi:hypothetical protein
VRASFGHKEKLSIDGVNHLDHIVQLIGGNDSRGLIQNPGSVVGGGAPVPRSVVRCRSVEALAALLEFNCVGAKKNDWGFAQRSFYVLGIGTVTWPQPR